MSDLTQALQRVRAAYSPEVFQQTGEALIAELAKYLTEAQSGSSPVLPWVAPPDLIAAAKRRASPDPQSTRLTAQQISEGMLSIGRDFLKHAHRLHSPRYMGHQVPASIPLAGLLDALGSTANQPMAIYEMGPTGTAAERAMLDVLAGYLGWTSGGYDAVATHGGSLANLTALLTARNVHYPDCWERGVAALSAGGKGRPAIVCGADSHYSVARAAGILGLGTDQVVRAPLDERRRLDVDRLPEALQNARDQGLDVFCIVGSACSTPIGAFDPLEPLADFAQEYGLWFHVDGAHGASVLLSNRHRGLVDGVERADSVTWDAHKMMFMPALCTLLFYKDAATSYQTFRQDAPYLFDPQAPGLAAYDGAVRTVECTKRAMCTGLWGVWSIFGPQLFEDLIDLTFDLAQRFYALLADCDDFEPMHQPQCNIVCFRHIPSRLRGADDEQLSQFQLALRRRLIESGEFYVTAARLDGRSALRVTLINPLTQTSHLEELLDAVRRHGEQMGP